MFDQGLQAMLLEAPEEHHEHVRGFIERQRKYHLGWTAVEITLHGETSYVYDQAFAIANDMAAVFRFMSPAAPTARLPFPCFALDKPVCPTRTAYLPQANGSFGMTSGMIHQAMHNYRMTFAEFDELMRAGLSNLTMFFDGRKLNDHQERARSALMAYSRGIGSFDQEDRLIYAMTAAEHLLLSNSDEPIQSNVSDRMAFLVAQDAGGRRRVAKNFKDAYVQRSRYVHHHLSVSDQAVLEEFFRNMYVMLFTVISNMPKIGSQAEFLNMLEEAKFS